MGQDDLTHVDVLLVESVIQLNALQLIRSFFTFLNESFTLPNLTDLTRKVLEFFRTQLMVAIT